MPAISCAVNFPIRPYVTAGAVASPPAEQTNRRASELVAHHYDPTSGAPPTDRFRGTFAQRVSESNRFNGND